MRIAKPIKLIIKIFLAGVLIINYVPVKFAVKTDNIPDEGYVCEYSTATSGNWVTVSHGNSSLKGNINLNIREDKYFSRLKDINSVRKGELPLNKYVFYGNISKKQVSKNTYFYYMDLSGWDVVYPIQRGTLRSVVTPPNYLTLCDFVWQQSRREQ